MSRTLVGAKKGHLHSPVDDLESFFWVAVWTVFSNKDHEKNRSEEEKSIMEHLSWCRKDVAMSDYSVFVLDSATSNIVRHLRPILLDWWMRVRDRSMRWTNQVPMEVPNGAHGKYYLPHFHCFAPEGVVDVLEVLLTHWDKEAGWKSWVLPGPAA